MGKLELSITGLVEWPTGVFPQSYVNSDIMQPLVALCRRPCAKGSAYYTYFLLNIYWIKQKLSE